VHKATPLLRGATQYKKANAAPITRIFISFASYMAPIKMRGLTIGGSCKPSVANYSLVEKGGQIEAYSLVALRNIGVNFAGYLNITISRYPDLTINRHPTTKARAGVHRRRFRDHSSSGRDCRRRPAISRASQFKSMLRQALEA
jgi:hypothetical protein